MALDVLSRFYRFQKFASKKIRRMGSGKTTFNFYRMFHMDANKMTPPANREGLEVLRSFCCLHLQGALFVPVDWSCTKF